MKQLWTLLGVVGFFFLLGTAGTADLAEMSLMMVGARLFAGMAMMGASYLGHRACEVQEMKRRKMAERRRAIREMSKAAETAYRVA